MPLHIQKELLESVFGRESVLHIGMVTFTLAAFICYMVTSDTAFLGFPFFLFVVFVYRLYIFRGYAAAKDHIDSPEEVEGWETHYIHGSVGATFGLGVMGGYSAFHYPNSIATTICLGVVLGAMLTVVGRNFGSIKNVQYMAVACCGPMMIGFVWGGVMSSDAYLFLASLLLVSVYATSMQLAKYLRSLLMKAGGASGCGSRFRAGCLH